MGLLYTVFAPFPQEKRPDFGPGTSISHDLSYIFGLFVPRLTPDVYAFAWSLLPVLRYDDPYVHDPDPSCGHILVRDLSCTRVWPDVSMILTCLARGDYDNIHVTSKYIIYDNIKPYTRPDRADHESPESASCRVSFYSRVPSGPWSVRAEATDPRAEPAVFTDLIRCICDNIYVSI